MKVLSALVGVTFMVACGSAEAGFVDNETELGPAISELRSAIGNHPRVLKIEVDPNVVTIEAQDPRECPRKTGQVQNKAEPGSSKTPNPEPLTPSSSALMQNLTRRDQC